MTYFQILRKLEIIEKIFNASKAVAVSLGAKEETFFDTESKLKDLKADFSKKVSGGIVSDALQDGQVGCGEYIVNNRG